MPPNFNRTVLSRLPLAEAVLTVWLWITEPSHLDSLFQEHRGRCYQDKITFALVVQLLADALLQHGGSGRKSFQRSREQGELEASIQAAYQKVARLPFALTEAFLAVSTQRLRAVAPTAPVKRLPASLRALVPIALDGKIVKKVPKRLKPLRQTPGGVLGGKGLVALDLARDLAVAMATDPDGEANDAKLVPALVPQVLELYADDIVLWLGDRQFCDLNQMEQFTRQRNHFVVRYHPKVHFFREEQVPVGSGTDAQGRQWQEEWGWLGGAKHPKRRYVRRITLERPGEEPIILVTDLLDPKRYPANDLLALYLMRWGIERVFQKITEVFHLEHLIGTTPQGTLFQLAFCLLIYNVIQVVRGYVAVAEEREAETISLELLFDDVQRDLVALHEVLDVVEIVELFAVVPTPEAVRQRLTKLLSDVWTDRWIKAPSRKRQPPPKKSKAQHTSVYRLLNQHRQQQSKAKLTG
jgi:Transposase DDE domain